MINKILDNRVLLLILGILTALFVSGAVYKMGMLPAIGVIGLSAGAIYTLSALKNMNFALISFLTILYVIFQIARVLPVAIPIGPTIDILTVIFSASVLINQKKTNFNLSSHVRSPVFILLAIWVLYSFLQVFNANTPSVWPWFVSVKQIFVGIILPYIIFSYFFQNFKQIKVFFISFFFLGTLAGVYALHQEYVGLFDFENRWLHADPKRFNLLFIWGHIRKWSFLSNVDIFGILAAYCALNAIVLAMGPTKQKNKILLAISTIVLLLGMAYSGTRTAYAMIPGGLAFYVVMTIYKRQSIITAFAGILAFVFILYAPIYNGTFKRLRSAFAGSEDPSMNLRNINRAKVQPYMYSHPLGGGIATTGGEGLKTAPGHPLAGFPPDSGYLKTGLEKGWIGMFLTMLLNISVMCRGIYHYFRMKYESYKAVLLALLTGFFSLMIANYTQEVFFKKPLYIAVVATYLLVDRLYQMDKLKRENEEFL